MGSLMPEVSETAVAWVDAWIARHIRTLVLDGKPSKMFRDALIKDVSELLAAQQTAKPPAKKAKPNAAE